MRTPPDGRMLAALPDARSGLQGGVNVLTRNGPSRRRAGPTRRRAGVLAGVAAVAALLLMVSALAGPGAGAQVRLRAAPHAVTGNECPSMVFEPDAALYPAQPSFYAGYQNYWQKFTGTTTWGYVVTAQFPYAQWMSWNVYNQQTVPVLTVNRTQIQPDKGSVNPFVTGVPILAPKRSYHLYLMPFGTSDRVLKEMRDHYGDFNVIELPDPAETPSWAIIERSYWSFGRNGGITAQYDRFGYDPPNVPFPTIHAFLTNPTTGALTNTPAGNCGAHTIFPRTTWYNPATQKPVINAAKIPRPVVRIVNVPNFLLRNGFVVSSAGSMYAAPTPVPQYVQFYRPVASDAPFADVSQIPAKGTPPDACSGYVIANLPNNRVSLIHIPEVPTFPNYAGATSSTPRTNSDDVQFFSLIMYGVNRQIYSFGNPNPVQALRNAELGNQDIAKNSDGSATFVIYPTSATAGQVARIAAIAKANGWNILHGGVKTRAIPLNVLALREKGQNPDWNNALSANDVTQGAPCPQSFTPDLPLPSDPPSAQATQTNGMGLTAPNGQNCTIAQFTSGRCLSALILQYTKFGWKWNAAGTFPPGQR